jgi:RNA polymerase sigma factor (sigma-70 family)
MQSKETGLPAKTRLVGDLHTLNFEQLFKQFKRDIEWYASGYPKSWQMDFCQEGAIALFDAYQKFIILPSQRDFRSYALTAIDHRMIDFYRKTIEKRPVFQEAVFIDEEGEEQELIYNYSGDRDYFITTTFDMDYQIVFNDSNLTAKGFTESELKVFNLHMIRDIPVTKVAGELRLSPGRVSQLITSLREKTQWLLNQYNKN